MYSARLYPLSLILVGILVVAAHVEPPTNVTLRCGNMKDILEWEYANLSWAQGLRFRVDIQSYHELEGFPKEIWVNSSPLQADVSFLSHPDQEYMLTVTAILGQKVSEPSPEAGIFFSYFQNSQVPQKCSLDFPSVTVIAQPNKEVQLRFDHPWVVYLKDKSHDENGSEEMPIFVYNVDVLDQPEDHTFTCEEAVCVETVTVNQALEKYCMKFSGELKKIAVKGKEEYCVHHPPKEVSYAYIFYISVGLLAVIVVASLSYMMYHKVTNPHTPFPPGLDFTRQPSAQVNEMTEDQKNIVQVEPKSPTPLLPPKSEEYFPKSSGYEWRMRLGLQTEDEGVSDVGEQQNECPDYMHGNDFEDDDTVASAGYERRDVLVEIDPNEQTQGYRG